MPCRCIFRIISLFIRVRGIVMVIKMSERSVGKLEEQAFKRKQKLQALKRKREGDGTETAKTLEEHITLPK